MKTGKIGTNFAQTCFKFCANHDALMGWIAESTGLDLVVTGKRRSGDRASLMRCPAPAIGGEQCGQEAELGHVFSRWHNKAPPDVQSGRAYGFLNVALMRLSSRIPLLNDGQASTFGVMSDGLADRAECKCSDCAQAAPPQNNQVSARALRGGKDEGRGAVVADVYA